MLRPSGSWRARIAPRPHPLRATFACLLGALAGPCARAEAAGPPVGGSRYESTVTARGPEDRAAASSVITEDRTPRAGENLAELISELPGVRVNRLGGIGSLATLSIRGSAWNQVAVYVDGIPLNNGIAAGVDLSTLPLGDIERVEIYRGVSPVAFGGSALGGVVSITTRSPRADRVTGELLAGSFDTFGGGATGALARKRLRVYAGAHHLASRNDFLFTSDNGTAFDPNAVHEERRRNNAVVQTDGVLRVVVPIDAGRELTVGGLAFVRDQGLPGFGVVRQTSRTSLETMRFAGSAIYDSRRDLGGNGRLRAQVYYLFERQRFDDPLGEIALAPASTHNLLRTLGGNLRLKRALTSWAELAAVIDARNELFEPYDGRAIPRRVQPGTRWFAGLGAEADFFARAARLHLLPSLRVEVARDQRSARDEVGMPEEMPGQTSFVPSARLGLQAQPTRWLTLRANAARAGRLPSMTELYGNSGYLLGNPELRPESGWNADAGFRLRGAASGLSAEIDAAFFASFVEDLIQYQQDAYGRARAVNLGRARVLGVEASLDVHAGRHARLWVSTTFLDARDVSDTSLGRREPQLPNRPRFRCYLRPEGRVAIGRAMEVGAYVDVDVTVGNYLDPANLIRQAPRVLVGAGLFAEIPRARMQLVVSAENLGDARVFDFAGFPLPSRSFFATARLALGGPDPS